MTRWSTPTNKCSVRCQTYTVIFLITFCFFARIENHSTEVASNVVSKDAGKMI